MTRVLFVCLGNICRSPLAEGILQQMIEEQHLQDQISCDSCGTAAYHIGSQPDHRTIANAQENGVFLNHHARQFEASDFERFDHIFVMDHSNLGKVRKFEEYEENSSKVELMRAYDPQNPNSDVPDPYYGGAEGFQEVFDILNRCCSNLLEKLKRDA